MARGHACYLVPGVQHIMGWKQAAIVVKHGDGIPVSIWNFAVSHASCQSPANVHNHIIMGIQALDFKFILKRVTM